MLSDGYWWCWGEEGGQKGWVCLPLKKKTVPSVRHPFTSHPSPHPCHAPSSHLKQTTKTKRHLHVSFIHPLSSTPSLVPVFHFSGFCRFFSLLSLSFLSRVLFLYIKKSYSFLFQCVSQSVCLSMSIWPASRLSGCRWQVGSPGGRPHQADSEGWSPCPRSVWT